MNIEKLKNKRDKALKNAERFIRGVKFENGLRKHFNTRRDELRCKQWVNTYVKYKQKLGVHN